MLMMNSVYLMIFVASVTLHLKLFIIIIILTHISIHFIKEKNNNNNKIIYDLYIY